MIGYGYPVGCPAYVVKQFTGPTADSPSLRRSRRRIQLLPAGRASRLGEWVERTRAERAGWGSLGALVGAHQADRERVLREDLVAATQSFGDGLSGDVHLAR